MHIIWHPGWLVTLFVIATIACTTNLPPRDLIERDDHAALMAWYAQESVRLREKANEMRRMAEEYAKPTYPLSPKETKEELLRHCQLFSEYYDKAAVEADALAHLHHEAANAIP